MQALSPFEQEVWGDRVVRAEDDAASRTESPPAPVATFPSASARSRLVIVSNRLPVQQVEREGRRVWETSPGGLVSALRSVLSGSRVTWIGWSGVPDETPAPFEVDQVINHPVGLTAEECEAFYDGFSNRTLWPLYHDAVRAPEYRRAWWPVYAEVNRRFAREAAAVAPERGAVWIHDYHLQLAPQMLRDLRPDLRIGFFLHIPFPPLELFSRLPWRRDVVEGILGADVIGFQTPRAARNFAALSRKYTTARGDRGRLVHDGRRIACEAYPISIDVVRFETLAETPAVRNHERDLRARLGDGRRILLGLDRLDYTKGIDVRLRAYQELLRSGRTSLDDSVFVQVAVPSRDRVEEYVQLKQEVDRLVGEINGEFARLGRSAVHYLWRSLPTEELIALYRIADVMVVTPFCDGMNLVAKEYVACRTDDAGVLVLSEFTGAAQELTSALTVNPHDVDGVSAVMHAALSMPVRIQRRRMRALRRTLHGHTVFNWAESFLGALAP